MGFVLALFAFVFLIAGIATQVVSYLTANMYENTLIAQDHQGLFRRCGARGVLHGITQVISTGDYQGGCYWWDRNIFNADPKWLQATMILAIVSAGVVALLILFSLITLIPRFKTRRLRIFVGVLALFNAIVLAAVVAIYTTLNDRSIKFQGGLVNYSWSYWLLYGGIGSFLFSAVFFCCNQPSIERD